MLTELRIRNVAVIDSVTLTLSDGFNVLTGETGAGKSLIVGALGLLLGDRAAADRIREGADRAAVEGLFVVPASHSVLAALDARGIDTELESTHAIDGAPIAVNSGSATNAFNVVLKREVSTNGRSRAWINGSPVTVGVLSEVGAMLVSVHGQHESRNLVDVDHQRDVLDAYSGADAVRMRLSEAYGQLVACQTTERELESRQSEALRRSDYLRYVVEEIKGAAIAPGEDEQLESDIRKLSHAGELQQLAGEAHGILSQGDQSVLAQLSTVRRLIAGFLRLDPDAGEMQSGLDGAVYALEELASQLSDYAESVEVDPVQLEWLESRRDLVLKLLRKYGPAIGDVERTATEAAEELAQFEQDDNDLEQVRANKQNALVELEAAAQELTALRARGAEQFGKAVSQYFPQLGIPAGRLEVRLVPMSHIGPHGAESVQFEVALNAGESMHLLSRVASGGELSRVMLAMSTVLSRLQQVPTLVFDEIDAGVGGAIAWQVGSLMRQVAQHHQVLAISHLAQIASRANTHIVVHKSAVGTVTTADTRVLEGEDRVLEIARMLGGDADREVSRAHARELLTRRDDVASTAGTSADVASQSKPRPASTQRRGKPV